MPGHAGASRPGPAQCRGERLVVLGQSCHLPVEPLELPPQGLVLRGLLLETLPQGFDVLGVRLLLLGVLPPFCPGLRGQRPQGRLRRAVRAWRPAVRGVVPLPPVALDSARRRLRAQLAAGPGADGFRFPDAAAVLGSEPEPRLKVRQPCSSGDANSWKSGRRFWETTHLSKHGVLASASIRRLRDVLVRLPRIRDSLAGLAILSAAGTA